MSEQKYFIHLQTPKETLTIPFHSILYFEYHLRYKNLNRITKLHALTRTYILHQNISSVFSMLNPSQFVIPHKSFIINMMHIKKLTQKEIIMDNNAIIPLSQKQAAKIRKDFLAFLGF